MTQISCGGAIASGGPTPIPPTPPVPITVSAGAPPIIYPNFPGWPYQTAQFVAAVSNTSNPAVTWAVATADGGSIDANGMYTAPVATLPGNYSNILVTATESNAVHSIPVTMIVQ